MPDSVLELMTFQLQGHTFALRLHPGLTVVPIPHLIRPPLLPPHLSGLALVDDRTLVLADLGACLGYASMTSRTGLQALLPEGDEAGFVLSGPMVETRCAAAALSPLPELLASPLWEGCLLHEGTPVPVIAIDTLQRLVHGQELDPAAYLHSAPPGFATQDQTYLTRLTVAGQPFALAEPEPERVVATSALTGLMALPGRPASIVGLASFGRELLPLFDVRSAFGLPADAILAEVLLWRRNGQLFGLRVDSGSQPLPPTEPVALPPPAASALLGQAVVAPDDVLPLLDLPQLVAGAQAVPLPPPTPLTGREVLPMGAEPLAVREVALRGNRLALLAEESGEPFPACAWQPLPTTHLLLAGVAHHDKRLWPVLDLGGCFGQSAGKMTGLLMVPVTRDDFHALLLVEEDFGQRLLAPEEQRVLPVAVPGHIVHGCYLGTQSVHLIVDVAALSAMIEPVEIRTLQRFFDDYWSVPEAATETLDDAIAPAAERQMEIGPQTAMAETAAASPPVAAAEDAVAAPVFPRPEDAVPSPALAPDPEQETPNASCAPPDADLAAAEEERAPAAAVLSDTSAATESPIGTEQADTAGDVFDPVNAPEEPIAEVLLQGSDLCAASDNQSTAPATAASGPVPEDEADSCTTDVLQAEPEADELAAAVAELTIAANTPIEEFPPPPHERRSAAGDDIDLSQLFTERESAPVAKPVAALIAEPPPLAPSAAAFATTAADASINPVPPPLPACHPAQRIDRRWLAAAIILLLLGGTGFWLWQRPEDSLLHAPSVTPRVGTTVGAPVPPQAPAPRPAVPPAPALVSAPVPQAAATATPRPQPRPTFDLAPALPGTEYQVRRGDTLWDISARYTGDPFTYPDLARKNRIDNPHLIFPGQVIRVPAATENDSGKPKP